MGNKWVYYKSLLQAMAVLWLAHSLTNKVILISILHSCRIGFCLTSLSLTHNNERQIFLEREIFKSTSYFSNLIWKNWSIKNLWSSICWKTTLICYLYQVRSVNGFVMIGKIRRRRGRGRPQGDMLDGVREKDSFWSCIELFLVYIYESWHNQ